MAYRYQKELDLLEATRDELNITDAQYDELTSKMKDEGNAEWFKPWKEPQFSILGYDVEHIKFWIEQNRISFSIAAKEPGYHTFEAGLPVVIDLGKDINGNDYSTGHSPLSYCSVDNSLNGPPCVASQTAVNTVTIVNQVPEGSGPYGQYLNMVSIYVQDGVPMTEEDLEHFKKNLKIKIG